MGDTSLLMMPFQTSISVLDSHVAFKEAAKLERSEVDVPDAVIDFLQADVLADADGGNVDGVYVRRSADSEAPPQVDCREDGNSALVKTPV